MAGSVFAEDVLILHQSYGNTHNKWKNRLEDASEIASLSESMNAPPFESRVAALIQVASPLPSVDVST